MPSELYYLPTLDRDVLKILGEPQDYDRGSPQRLLHYARECLDEGENETGVVLMFFYLEKNCGLQKRVPADIKYRYPHVRYSEVRTCLFTVPLAHFPASAVSSAALNTGVSFAVLAV